MTPRRSSAAAALLMLAAGCAGQPWQSTLDPPERSCPIGSSNSAPWVAVITKRQPLSVQMKVTGEYDPGSAGAWMVERGGRAAAKWVVGGLTLGAAVADRMQRFGERNSSQNASVDLTPIAAPVGALVLVASLATAPIALIAGGMQGASEAAAYSRRHEAAGRRFEEVMREAALEARLALSMVDTLTEVASGPVHFVDGARFAPEGLLARCGAVVALELEFESVEFEAPSVIEFVARPSLTARYRLSQAGTGRAPVSGTAQVAGRYHKFSSIEEDGAGLLGQELIASIDAISSRMLAALPSTVAWTRPADTRVAARAQLTTHAENLSEPLRVHPDLIQPSSLARSAEQKIELARIPPAARVK